MKGAHLKFVNDIIKPWDELNELLTLRYVFEPELSDITRIAASLAVFINHYGEPNFMPDQLAQESFDMKIIRDVADSSKHFKLSNPARQSKLSVGALFEVRDDNQFRFLRNRTHILHSTEGELDFMIVSLGSIRYWIDMLGLDINWNGEVKEAVQEYYPTAWLNYEPKYCINVHTTNYRFFKLEGDSLQPYDPPNWVGEIYDAGKLGARVVTRNGKLIL